MRRQLTLLSVFLIGVAASRGAWADAPTVTITYPPANAIISEALTPKVLLQASITDADEEIAGVYFYVCWIYESDCLGGWETWVSSPPGQFHWTASVQWSTSASTPNGGTLSFMVYARAYNALGQSQQSSMVPFTYIQIPTLSVTLVAPNGASSYVTPTAPVLYATASPGDTSPPSTIARIDFLDGGNIIGTVTTPNAVPSGYALVWQGASPGMHLIAARATDTLGNARTSKAVTVSIIGLHPRPLVTLSAPTTGQIYAPPNAVPLAATASSALGTIQRVEFVTDGMVIGTALSPPYAMSWVNPPPGNFAIVATAYDVSGVATTSPAAYVQVLSSPRPPAVVLTAPAPGATVPSNTPLLFAASALAPDGGIERVDFYSGATLLGSAATVPYQFSWPNPTVGALSLVAKAYDLQGHVGVSAPVGVTVTSGPVPVVTLTAPAAGATFTAPATIGLSATASEVGGSIVRVEFFANGSLIGTAINSPYNFSWGGVAAGNYTLTAKATDTRSVTATSAAVAITVINNQPPLVALNAPSNGQSFLAGQPIALSATASDPDGTVTRVDFLADGAVVGTVTTGPYTMMWNSAPVGPHALTARATDNLGAPTTSTVINITVGPHRLPTVALTLPRTGQVFSAGALITVAAAAAAGEGTLARAEFYADGVLVATAIAMPYSATWSGAAAGTHTLTAKAIDDVGAVITSAGVTIQVVTLALTITTPPPNASVAADFVLVSGTYQGPPNSGITANGVVATNDGLGRYFANNVPLTDGLNTLTVTMTAQDGQATTHTQTITSTATAPMQVYADSDADFSPATYTIRVTNRTANTITHISYLNLGGGQLDTSSVDQTTLGKITYSAPGVYTPGFVITDSAGNTYTQTLAILAQDRAALDQMLKAVWADFTGALAAGDKASAMQRLNGPAQEKYGPVFDALANHMAAIVATWSAPVTGMLSAEIADFGLNRTVDGINRVFLINLIRGTDGVWRLDSM